MSLPLSQNITRKSASNLALSFILLPAEKRRAMAVLYAFCREVDDVADETSAPLEKRRTRLAAWREDVQAAVGNGRPRFPLNRELQPVIAQYRLPLELFEELLRGVEMDLDITRYADYAALEEYCYRVASVVGLLSIQIFGYHDPKCRDYAVHLGKALQLTNILRDVRADAARDRLYLPLAELARFGVTPEEVLGLQYSARFQALAASVAARARLFYQRAQEALPAGDRPAMAAAELMAAVYGRLLRRIEARQFDVFRPPPPRLGKAEKLWLIARTWWRLRSPNGAPAREW